MEYLDASMSTIYRDQSSKELPISSGRYYPSSQIKELPTMLILGVGFIYDEAL